jgi:hypothetical protein
MPPTKAPSKALTVAKELSQAELNALLQGAGYASVPGERQERISLKGQIFTASDTGEMFVYNPKHPENPAFTARIVKPVSEYNAIYIDEAIARQFERLDLANTFSKKFYQPDPDRRVWPSDEAYDDLARHVGEFIDKDGKPMKHAWKGDLLLQILPEDGTLTGEETEYLLTLATTSLIEFKGTSKAPEAGAVSEFNFMQKLVRFAIESAAEGIEPSKAVLDALTSYAMGGVVAEVRVGNAENKSLNQSWTVAIFDPIHIEPADSGAAALPSGDPDEVGL